MLPHTVTPTEGPRYLSAEARKAIEQPIIRTPYPAREDSEGWLRLIDAVNAQIAGALPEFPLQVSTAARQIGATTTYVATPHAARADGPLVLDLHGGALIFCGGDLTRRLGELDALQTGVEHWSPDYRMPPAHPFPAALDDVVGVYRAMLEIRDPQEIVVSGGSAGGNLAAALMLRLRDDDVPLPAGLILQTPEIDLTESGDSFHTLADVSVGLQSLAAVNELYAAGHPLDDPLLSPLFADLTGFPPTLLICGTRDLFLSNTVRMHRKLREAGNSADLHVFDARPHGGYGPAPEEERVTAEVRAFIVNRTSEGS